MNYSSKKKYKIILLGNGNVGKTSLKRSFLDLEFVDKYQMTNGVEFGIKNELIIYDIGGQFIWTSIEEYFKNAKGAVLVYDITNRKSFESLDKWYEKLVIHSGKNIPFVIAGNKADLREFGHAQVDVAEGYEYAAKMSNQSIFEIPYFETSALTGLNVNYVFEHLLLSLDNLTES